MNTLRAAFAISTIFLFVACGDSGTGGTGGSGGSSGGSTAGTGGSGTGGSGTGGSGTGTAGATGSAGTGGGANCPMCVTCITTNCSSQVATCQASTSCNALYECGRTCTTPINDCVAMHLDAIQVWATVSACINNNCRVICGL